MDREEHLYVAARGEMSRERAARRLKISRALAAFHLDKLVERGLLEVRYRRLTGRTGRGAGRRQAVAVLRDYGFAPMRADGGLRLRNCPFDAVARDHRALVCGANLCVMEGLVAGLGIPGIKPDLDPRPGQCCVTFRTRRKRRAGKEP